MMKRCYVHAVINTSWRCTSPVLFVWRCHDLSVGGAAPSSRLRVLPHQLPVATQ